MTGVIGHVPNPDRAEVTGLARRAEEAGADWIGFADAFWWRDVWMLLDAVAEATTSIEIGPTITNPYLRHPFHTASALATLHEVARGRVFCGIGAGGSELSAAAHIPRDDAAVRVAALVDLLRGVSAGAPLDDESGRALDLVLSETPILIAGRGSQMLRTAGALADRILLWAIPRSDLRRSVDLIRGAAAEAGREPRLVWAPLVGHADVAAGSLGHAAVYAALNSTPSVRSSWGLDDNLVDEIRSALVAGRLQDAVSRVPASAMEDLVVDPDNGDAIANLARELGVTELAVPGFAVDTVAGHVTWARTIEASL